MMDHRRLGVYTFLDRGSLERYFLGHLPEDEIREVFRWADAHFVRRPGVGRRETQLQRLAKVEWELVRRIRSRAHQPIAVT